MPYIITHRNLSTPDYRAARENFRRELRNIDIANPMLADGRMEARMEAVTAALDAASLVSRRTVATLDEARAVAKKLSNADAQRQWEALEESGGMIGPLPDGTVIEVERV